MNEHQLVDLGGAARLERFGDRLIDRPAPGALGTRATPALWQTADLRFDRDGGWSGPTAGAGPWSVDLDGLTFELRTTDAGQVGLFPEHATMLPWLREQVMARLGDAESWTPASAPAILHLFAYTGLATLAMAAAGAAVTHVDASRPTVSWARHNAERSGLADRPIRWIVDDAVAFTEREVRRGRHYAGVVLDPPSYGHGPKTGAWEIERNLAPLLVVIAGLLEPEGFVLVTAHTPSFGENRLASAVEQALGRPSAALETGELGLLTEDGRRLALGAFVRASGGA